MELDLVDVFAGRRLGGNPLAVVRGAGVCALGTEQMLRLTQWLGFSETTFLLPPTDPAADYQVRIFYPAGELPFAGHPTLGSAFAWLAAGGVPKRAGVVVQQCGIGLVDVARRGEGLDGASRLAFLAPPLLRTGALDEEERAEAVRLSGVDPACVVDAVHAANGPPWKLLRLSSARDVLAARPAARAPAGTDIGLAGPWADGASEAGGAAWEIRAFFTRPGGGLAEDPVTGSLNAAVALYLFAQGLAHGDYTAAQGRCVDADGRVYVSRDAEASAWIGGDVAMVASGASVTSG